MLLTLISTLLGAVSNILPAIVSLVQKKNDQAHEVEMAKLDMQKIDMQAKNQLAITNINADVGETNAIHAADASSSGDGFWSGVSASVRPVLTYIFFGLFVCVKVSALVVILNSGLSIIDAMPILWDENTIAIFGSIMGFYFGSRTLERFGFYARPNNNRVSTTVSQPTK